MTYRIRSGRSLLTLVIVASSILALAAVADTMSPSDLTSAGSQKQETSLGDLVADAVRNSAGTPIAFVPAGAFREADVTIRKGNVKADDVLKCLQYPDDKIAVIELTGNQITKALERGVSIYPQASRSFLQVSGIEVKFNPKAAKGSRITSVAVGKEKLVSDKKYLVGTTKPLAGGEYGYFTIWGKDLKPEIKVQTTAQAVREFISGKVSADYRKTDRIQAKEK